MEQLSNSPRDWLGAEDFLTRLMQVFPGEFPPDFRLTECTCDECAELRRDFGGMRWTEVPGSILVKNTYVLSLLGKSAIRYHLPAFLRATMTLSGTDLEVSVVDLLGPSGIGSPEIAKFAPAQRAMIQEYLQRLGTFDEEEEKWQSEMLPSKRWLKMLARWAP